MQHLLQFDMKINYDPLLLRDMDIKYGASVPTELFLIPLWHASLPDEIVIDNITRPLEKLLYAGTNIVFNQGLDNMINAMTETSAGEVSVYRFLFLIRTCYISVYG